MESTFLDKAIAFIPKITQATGTVLTWAMETEPFNYVMYAMIIGLCVSVGVGIVKKVRG